MNLIEEIEAADHCTDPHGLKIEALCILASPYWKRIKAALEAAQEMEVCLDVTAKLVGAEPSKATIERARFRAAMEGKE